MFFIVLLIIVFGIPNIRWVKTSGLSTNTLRTLLFVQLTAGLAVGWYTYQYHPTKDYWSLHTEGLIEYATLKKDPVEFFKNITYSPYSNPYGQFFNAVGSYWNDLRNNLMAKILALLNLISRGNYYTNSLFYNAMVFLGHLIYFNLFKRLYPDQKNLLIVSCFLLPSVLLFVSGIHKDGIVFTALAVFCYHLYLYTIDRLTKKRFFFLLISWLALLTMRNFLAMLLIPLCIIYIISEKRKTNVWLSFGIGFLAIIAGMFVLEKINAPLQPAAIISQRQADFSDLTITPANIKLDKLEPTTGSLVAHLPEAVNHGLFRPYPFETKLLFTQIMSLEWWLYMIVIAITVTISIYKRNSVRPMVAFVIILPVCLMIISGWIVPNLNAIIRYRSIYLPMLITPFLIQFFKNSHRIKF